MKILQVHNFYQQPGGEDAVFANERNLLCQNGHQVLQFTMDNDEIHSMSRGALVARTIWNRQTFQQVQALIRSNNIELVHCHNTFPLISPSVYWAANGEGVPVVQTTHNYRLVCPAATLWREGHPCEDCLQGRSMLSAIRHKCYRGSSCATTVLAGMLQCHQALGTWERRVTRYIALTEFMRGKLVLGGVPASMISVKPNFSTDSGSTPIPNEGYFLFAGRIAPEKGLDVLAKAWTLLPHVPLRVAGGGPELTSLREAVSHLKNVTVLGPQEPEHFSALLRRAQCLVVPSTWYEGFPMVVVEAFSAGIPVLAANHGGLAEIVCDGVTGRLFRPSDAADLAAKVAWFVDHPTEADQMRKAARCEYQARYTPEKNYAMLMEIYHECLASAGRQGLGESDCVPTR